MARLLILRPEPGASATAAKARKLGIEVVAAPLFQIDPADWIGPDPIEFDGLLLTSANAVRSAGDQLHRYRGLGVYAVGEATASAARRAGLDVAAIGDSGVDRLLASIAPDLRLLHLCGEHHRAPDGALQKITPVVVYRSTITQDPDLSKAHRSVALIHSSRAAQRFSELVENRRSIAIAAISSAAAQAVGPGWRMVKVAEQPTDDALLALGAMLCKNAQLG